MTDMAKIRPKAALCLFDDDTSKKLMTFSLIPLWQQGKQRVFRWYEHT